MPGKGAATRLGSFRIPLRQNSPLTVSTSDETGWGTPDNSGSPVSVLSSVHRDLELELVLRDSPARESKPLVSPSQTDDRTAQPTPSPPTGSLSGLAGKVGTSPTYSGPARHRLLGGVVWTRR